MVAVVDGNTDERTREAGQLQEDGFAPDDRVVLSMARWAVPGGDHTQPSPSWQARWAYHIEAHEAMLAENRAGYAKMVS